MLLCRTDIAGFGTRRPARQPQPSFTGTGRASLLPSRNLQDPKGRVRGLLGSSLGLVLEPNQVNHIHLIAVPETKDGLAAAVRQVHQRYTRMINFRQKKRGYLFQGRFHSCVMDEPYFLVAVGYVELNPVRAKTCARAWDYRWSSVGTHD